MAPTTPLSGQPQMADLGATTAGLNLPNHNANNNFGGNPAAAAFGAGGAIPMSTAAASSANPAFGGGGGSTFGSATQEMKNLTTEIKKLTEAIKRASGQGAPGMGGGGGLFPGMGQGGGGFGGGNGGGMGGSALDRQLLYGARGSMQRRLRGGGGGGAPMIGFDRAEGRVRNLGTEFGNADDLSGHILARSANMNAFANYTDDENYGFQAGFGGGFRGGANPFDRNADSPDLAGQHNLGPRVNRMPFRRTRGFLRGLFSSQERIAHLQMGREIANEDFLQRAAGMEAATGSPIIAGARVGAMAGGMAYREGQYQGGMQTGQTFRQYLGQNALHYGKQMLRGARDYGFRMGAAGNLVEMAAATPFVGGALAAPLSAHQRRGTQLASLELPSAVMSGFGIAGSGPSGSGPMVTHAGFLKNMATTLGMDAQQALQVGNQMLTASGGGIRNNAELFGALINSYGSGHTAASFSMNFAMRQAGSNLRNTGFTRGGMLGAVALADAAGLRGTSAQEFVQSASGLGAQFRGMGISLGKGTFGEIQGMMGSGRESMAGVGAIEAYGRIRQKTTIAASQSLGQMFGGIANDIMMAQAIKEANGNLDQASARLENMGVGAGKALLARGTGLKDGNAVFEMLQMGQGLTADERRFRSKRLGGMRGGLLDVGAFGRGASGLPLTRDIDLSAAQAQFTNEQLEKYGTGVTDEGKSFRDVFKEMLEQDKRIEDALLTGVKIQDFDRIVHAAGEISRKLQKVPAIIDYILSKIGA